MVISALHERIRLAWKKLDNDKHSGLFGAIVSDYKQSFVTLTQGGPGGAKEQCRTYFESTCTTRWQLTNLFSLSHCQNKLACLTLAMPWPSPKVRLRYYLVVQLSLAYKSSLLLTFSKYCKELTNKSGATSIALLGCVARCKLECLPIARRVSILSSRAFEFALSIIMR
jgi:hypothetical protein